jgi:hypothetical protein
LNISNRGLYALILTILFQSQLFAEYLYKDDLIHNNSFTEEINSIGSDLYKKTNIALRLLMLKEIPEGLTVYEYEQQILKEFTEPTILLTFSEKNRFVDIETNDKSLYKYFDKKQVLSPVTSYVQGLMMALFYAQNLDDFISIVKNNGGTILPLLGGKAKADRLLGKYSAAMFNGYLDIAQQITTAKGVKLANGYDSNTNQETLFYVKLLFYSVLLYAIIMYIRRFIYRRRHKDEYFKKW